MENCRLENPQDDLAEQNLELARSFSIIYRRSTAHMTQECQQFGLGFSEFVILMHLYGQQNFRQDSLAALLDVDKSVVTRTINLLERKGLVKRVANLSDRRVKNIYLTEAGLALKGQVMEIISSWSNLLLADLPDELVRHAISKMAAKVSGTNAMNKEVNSNEKTASLNIRFNGHRRFKRLRQ